MNPTISPVSAATRVMLSPSAFGGMLPALSKVLDFGIAKFVTAPKEDEPTRIANETDASLIIGTPAYMSPEQQFGLDRGHFGPASRRVRLLVRFYRPTRR